MLFSLLEIGRKGYRFQLRIASIEYIHLRSLFSIVWYHEGASLLNIFYFKIILNNKA